MRHGCSRQRNRGTSLVEALVALAVMAFGMLAVVGIQATLRLNADVAKQRSEAVRIAQQAMETARAFSVIDTDGVQVAYADINTPVDPAVVPGDNGTFTLTQTVIPRTAPDHKELRIRVEWTDRNGVVQLVELNSVIGANDPLVSRAVGAQPLGIPVRPPPMGRNPAIPPQAVSVGGGLSAFKPPSANGLVVWVFNDLTGMIVGVCNAVATGQAELSGADVAACSANANAQPLSGFVRFATEPAQPTPVQAESPASTALNLTLGVALTSTGHPTPDHTCFAAAPPSAVLAAAITVVPYYCAIFSNASRLWSGMSSMTPLGFSDQGNVPWALADSAADFSDLRYRVCRYTPAISDAVVVPNPQHPRTYVDVGVLEPLANQNFLVIRAGDGVAVPFLCPSDHPADPAVGDLVNSNTLPHQPGP